jgi:hypothetical protein
MGGESRERGMSVRQRIDRYWFEPARVRDLAYLRIAIVFVLLVDAMWPGTLARQLRLTRLPADWFVPIPVLKVLMLPFGWGARPGAALIVVAWIVCGVAGMGALVARTRDLRSSCSRRRAHFSPRTSTRTARSSIHRRRRRSYSGC